MPSITVLTSETHCSGKGGGPRLGQEDLRAREAAIEIRGDGLRLEELEIAVAQQWHFAEGMKWRRVQARAAGSAREPVLDPFS